MSARFRTIVADPPWQYQDSVSYSGPRLYDESGKHIGGSVRVARPLPYCQMTPDEIAALPVRDLADRDCLLWLWTTSAWLPQTFAVLDAWGFAYKQTLVWHKYKAAPALGGSVAPNHAEFCLIGKRGRPECGRLPSSVLRVPGNSGGAPKHSRKPDALIDFIEQISPQPWLEMFARRARFGWDYWGDESLNTVSLPEKTEAA